VRIAMLLWAVARRDLGGLRRGLEVARAEVMGPFSAAAMESYSRAYPHLVKLHILQEIDDAAGGRGRFHAPLWPPAPPSLRATLLVQRDRKGGMG
jgi:hypothetical protein